MAKTTTTASKILSRRVLVNIRRDQTAATPRAVWQHEIPILEDVFGEGSAQVVEDPAKLLDEGYSARPGPDLTPHNKKQDPIPRPSESIGLGWVFAGDPQAEYDRLAACYGMHPEVKQTYAEHVYGRFQTGRFSLVVGAAELDDMPDDQLRHTVLGWGADPAEVKAADRAALLTMAEDLGVQVGA